jgi:hypothetical protein
MLEFLTAAARARVVTTQTLVPLPHSAFQAQIHDGSKDGRSAWTSWSTRTEFRKDADKALINDRPKAPPHFAQNQHRQPNVLAVINHESNNLRLV